MKMVRNKQTLDTSEFRMLTGTDLIGLSAYHNFAHLSKSVCRLTGDEHDVP